MYIYIYIYQLKVGSKLRYPIHITPGFGRPEALLALTQNGQVVFRLQLSQAGDNESKRGGGLCQSDQGWPENHTF